jgi:hypothetical protein
MADKLNILYSGDRRKRIKADDGWLIQESRKEWQLRHSHRRRVRFVHNNQHIFNECCS